MSLIIIPLDWACEKTVCRGPRDYAAVSLIINLITLITMSLIINLDQTRGGHRHSRRRRAMVMRRSAEGRQGRRWLAAWKKWR